MLKKSNVSWATASPTQKAFIKEITRVNYKRELAKRELSSQTVRDFFDEPVSACIRHLAAAAGVKDQNIAGVTMILGIPVNIAPSRSLKRTHVTSYAENGNSCTKDSKSPGSSP